jgi:hypothetical protein
VNLIPSKQQANQCSPIDPHPLDHEIVHQTQLLSAEFGYLLFFIRPSVARG